MKNYEELIKRTTLIGRYRYLKLEGSVGIETFGFERHLNQAFYTSHVWRSLRDHVIIRDDGCDMGLEGHPIMGRLLVHHMNPITQMDIVEANPDILDPRYLICVSHETHNAIHYGDEGLLPQPMIERAPGDTKLW